MRRTQTPQRCYSPTEVRLRHGISKGLLDKEIKAGRLRVARVGRRILVPADAINHWLRKAMRK